MNRTDRLLAILLELQRKSNYTAEELAAHFETSKRTIYRDIQALCESGVPVVSQPGVGYSLMDGYFLPPLSFSKDEATMLLLGAQFMEECLDAQYKEAARSAAGKIEAVLPMQMKEDINYFRKHIAFVPIQTLSQSAINSTLVLLRRAVIEGKTVQYRYHTRYPHSGKPYINIRQVNPYKLTHYGNSWYLAGYCHLRNNYRSFKVDRMYEPEILEKTFERPKEFEIQRSDIEGRSIIIKALFTKDVEQWVRETPTYYITSYENTSDGFLVTMKVFNENDVYQWLLSWGASVKILEPESLCERIILEANKVISR